MHERLAEHLEDPIRAIDSDGPLRDRLEDPIRGNLLARAAREGRCRSPPSEHHQRDRPHVCLCDSGERVRDPWTGGHQDDPWLAGELSLPHSHGCRVVLVSGQDRSDPLREVDPVVDGEHMAARHAVDVAHAFEDKCSCDGVADVRDGHALLRRGRERCRGERSATGTR
jgi:hypothetical protein